MWIWLLNMMESTPWRLLHHLKVENNNQIEVALGSPLIFNQPTNQSDRGIFALNRFKIELYITLLVFTARELYLYSRTDGNPGFLVASSGFWNFIYHADLSFFPSYTITLQKKSITAERTAYLSARLTVRPVLVKKLFRVANCPHSSSLLLFFYNALLNFGMTVPAQSDHDQLLLRTHLIFCLVLTISKRVILYLIKEA